MRRWFSWQRVPVLILLAVLLVGLPACEKVRPKKKQLVAEIGKPAPDFSLTDQAGNTWRLSDLRGNVVFVNFWATWCKPCRDEMPSMEILNKSLAGQPFQMLAISYNDTPAMAFTFASRLGVTFPILADPGQKTASAYLITGVPETFIIDRDGVLRQKYIGPRQWHAPDVLEMLKRYMQP